MTCACKRVYHTALLFHCTLSHGVLSDGYVSSDALNLGGQSLAGLVGFSSPNDTDGIADAGNAMYLPQRRSGVLGASGRDSSDMDMDGRNGSIHFGDDDVETAVGNHDRMQMRRALLASFDTASSPASGPGTDGTASSYYGDGEGSSSYVAPLPTSPLRQSWQHMKSYGGGGSGNPDGNRVPLGPGRSSSDTHGGGDYAGASASGSGLGAREVSNGSSKSSGPSDR